MQNSDEKNRAFLVAGVAGDKSGLLLAALMEQHKRFDQAIEALEEYCLLVATPSTPAKPKRGRPPVLKNRPTAARFAKTVLVVDDEPAILELTRDILQTVGIQVIPASYGSQALELCSSGTEQIDLLLTDIHMPQMTGFEMAYLFSKQKPRVPIVFMSGDTRDFDYRSPASKALIQKPFKPDQLIEVIKRALGQE